MSQPSTTNFPRWSFCRTLSGRENVGIAVLGVLVAPTLEIGHRIYRNLGRLCSLQRKSPSSIRPSTPTSNSPSTLGFSLHGLYYRPSSGRWPCLSSRIFWRGGTWPWWCHIDAHLQWPDHPCIGWWKSYFWNRFLHSDIQKPIWWRYCVIFECQARGACLRP